MNLFISPHNDDEALFGAYTIMREKPLVLVVTDSYIQPNRGDLGCTKEQRRHESEGAAMLFGCPIIFAGLRDDTLTMQDVRDLLKSYKGFDKVYAPLPNSSNQQHNMIGMAAADIFKAADLQFYPTYTREQLYMTGKVEVKPTEEEIRLKNKALDYYVSQINLASTRPHFDAMRNKSEWLS